MTKQDTITQAMEAVLLSIINIKSNILQSRNRVRVSLLDSRKMNLLHNALLLNDIEVKTITYMMEDPFTVEFMCEDAASLLGIFEAKGILCA